MPILASTKADPVGRSTGTLSAQFPRGVLAEIIPEGTIIVRVHHEARGPLWFGPQPGIPPQQRFDAPGGEYRIAYLGTTREASFAEALLREPDVEFVTMRGIRSRRVSQVRVIRPVTLIALHGPGLARAGVSAAVATGDDYLRSRETARGLWATPEQPDGVVYRARHDDGEMSVALFDRASDAIEVADSLPLDDDVRWLASMALRYGFEFVP
ncbi:MAG: RES family NAD+ phosphorylase [Gemmatimonadales bacterium]